MEKQGLYSPEFEHENCGAGFICNLNGERTNQIIHDALEILVKLEHRGGVSADGKTGDGAGLLIDIPHDYFKRVCDFSIPNPREYAVGMVFLPKISNQYDFCKTAFENEIKAQGLSFLGWRKVPVDSSHLGEIALASEPTIEQLFVGKNSDISEAIFKSKLYAARKITEHTIRNSKISESNLFYIPSFSITTIIYKGIIMPEDIGPYYLDLQEVDLVTRLALVHQRFSTNTMPTWELAQPFRLLCQNGEINTLKGNVSRMRLREEIMKSDIFGDQIEKLFPIILPGKSDSASMDMVVELLTHTGRSLPEIMMMMIPEAWEKHQTMSPEKKAFYEYNGCIMEPWDGPASVPFTDGDYVGALLDRNGLRPSRYTVTKSGKLIMSSEIGVFDIDPTDILKHGRLEPGRMFLVDMNEGRIIEDEEIKSKIVSERPYKEWLDHSRLHLRDVPYTGETCPIESIDIKTRQRLFNYTFEDIQEVITPMAQNANEALGSMGTDTPLAVLSDRPQLISNYFKQLFAQVTNPPLDGIRENIVTDISLNLGKDRNIFSITDRQCRKLRIQNPVISNADLEKIRTIDIESFKAETIKILYPKAGGLNGLEDALNNIITQVEKALDLKKNIIILSDRGVCQEMAPIPALLACSYVNHQLNRLRKRSYFDIIIESAEPREPHHFATLFGYGASAINPYMVNEIIRMQVKEGFITGISEQKAVDNFNKAIGKGILKIMNKIGISTLHSYRGSQIFEIVGFNSQFVEKYFPYTTSRIEGIGLYEIEKEIHERYKQAYPNNTIDKKLGLNIGGDYRWRRNGERHLFNPTTVAKLQQAVRLSDQASYDIYAKTINEQAENLMTIRGLFEFENLDPIPLDEVEPWTEIVKRFKTGAMSYGSISKEAHENLAIAMNRIGGKSNSGEGGENRDRFQKDANGDSRNSAIKQVASGRFGVTSHYLTNAREIQIKMAQGAKPGEGGQLPGFKVLPWIAAARNSTPYVGLISPPPHHDIYSIEDLAQLIFDLKNANREARINVKLVSEVGVGTIAAGVAKAKADVVLISGYDGGTGASPLTSLKHAGLPWELGLAEAQQTLVLNNLRSRIVVECDGQLKTGRDVAIAALLGAEEFGFATAPLVASGCIMMRKCHLNTCPVGIATQDKELRKNFKGTPEHVINFFYYIAEELRGIMAQLGFRTLGEMVGQTHKINANKAIKHYKAKGLDLSSILHRPSSYRTRIVRNTEQQNHNLENVLDFTILKDSHRALYRKEKMTLSYPIKNINRAVGAIVSNEISKIYGYLGLPEDTLNINFTGSAGQSFGAFSAFGLTFTLEGNTNDYLGKGLSGAKLIIKKPAKADFIAEENIIVGNVCLFGAINGQAYINGIAGERFAVRNSGAIAVVEGVGDHCCEYMTGGKVVVLGKTGRNFAAGMSGGIAYVFDPENKFVNGLCNTESVDFETVIDDDALDLKMMVEKHYLYTNSQRAKYLLENWEQNIDKFIKVMPTEYKNALKRLETEKPMVEELTTA
ncbi:MAG: glutamate synthase large subunit [Flavobacteriia bacterium]|nr:glutamate synthase large subunit [Flavobacteriia bacterium]OIP47559.1 MAG: glutamate synthase subunit alpha [Flavobacteriaceae bacterium CG2_30_31_66]PIV97984.1 MAG: glutamate synthase large subunit [Flavobacteriaceae bacterium CG17_big_fil_post_rev_8_21_14_2_50_31_13]PIY15823.1 MAG: glutamate synthase large subunit [Flavobacteriaceae bacterium CG_4_10_14_3_um_filter_31_253]PIZ09814.1 MAG: glutamate synthase large subunit [Flavobacteriaceae bacterium CG_4_10_14_0_8_um_filter_31_99]PJC09143.